MINILLRPVIWHYLACSQRLRMDGVSVKARPSGGLGAVSPSPGGLGRMLCAARSFIRLYRFRPGGQIIPKVG